MTPNRRVRVGAAIGLVAALAVGLIVTSRIGQAGAPPKTPVVAPSPARCHDPTGRESHVHCTLDGVEVDYRLIRGTSANPASADALYVDAIGSANGFGSGRSRCAHGGEDEHSWSRPSQPRRVAGRFACRREHGRAAMWWTVTERGWLAHAVASDGDLARLFAWWLAHSER